jgi:hypothetical protein
MSEAHYQLVEKFLHHPMFKPALVEIFKSLQIRLDSIPDFVKQASFLYNLEGELFEKTETTLSKMFVPPWKKSEAIIDIAIALVARSLIGTHLLREFQPVRYLASIELDRKLEKRGYPPEYSYLLTDFPEQNKWETHESPPIVKDYYSKIIPLQSDVLPKIHPEVKSAVKDVVTIKVLDYSDEDRMKGNYKMTLEKAFHGITGKLPLYLAYRRIRKNSTSTIEQCLKGYDKRLDELTKLPELPLITHALV